MGGEGDLRESPNNVHDSCTEFFMEGTTNIIIYQVSKFIHSSILLVKRGSRDSHEIQLLTA